MLCVIKTRYCLEHVFYRLHNLLNASVVVVLENPLRFEGREHRFSLLMGQWQGSGVACDLGRHCAFMKNLPQCSLGSELDRPPHLLHNLTCSPGFFCLLQELNHWNDIRLNRGDKNRTAWVRPREGISGGSVLAMVIITRLSAPAVCALGLRLSAMMSVPKKHSEVGRDKPLKTEPS